MPTENAVDWYDGVLLLRSNVVSSVLAKLWNFGSEPICNGEGYGWPAISVSESLSTLKTNEGDN